MTSERRVNMESKILEARKQVQTSLARLAQFSASEASSIEYLLCVHHIMDIYKHYEKAILEEDEETILSLAEEIVCRIETM